jgi:hypothetical protein
MTWRGDTPELISPWKRRYPMEAGARMQCTQRSKRSRVRPPPLETPHAPRHSAAHTGGSVANGAFWGKIRKSGLSNPMTYSLQSPRKHKFATEPVAELSHQR